MTLPEDFANRLISLFSIIRSAERSRCLAVWIANHSDELSRYGYGQLFGHLQQTEYGNYVVLTVSLFERNSSYDIHSVRKVLDILYELHCQDRQTNTDPFCLIVEQLRNKLPTWPHKGFSAEPGSLDDVLEKMKNARDKWIAHKEFFSDVPAPVAPIWMPDENGCELLYFAMGVFDAIAPKAETGIIGSFRGENSKLTEIRAVTSQFERVVMEGFFAELIRTNGEAMVDKILGGEEV